MTICHLNKQSLDKRAINHAFGDGLNTTVNLAFILPPLLTQQTRLAFTIRLEYGPSLAFAKNTAVLQSSLPWQIEKSRSH